MAFSDQYDFSLLVNERERYVSDELEHQLESRPDVCRCQECVLDMFALALNHTKPAYRVTLLGAIYAQANDEETTKEIENAVLNAVNKIHENPSHMNH